MPQAIAAFFFVRRIEKRFLRQYITGTTEK